MMKVMLLTTLPQFVPSRVCFTCDVCCRFPEPDSFLRPYFTAEEIRRTIARGVDSRHFSDPEGCQVSVVPNPADEGYVCPAFDPATSRCRIYEERPLDCQIYPLAVMWSANESEVVLGWDAKCPFMRESAGERRAARGNREDLSPPTYSPSPGPIALRIAMGAPSSLAAYAERIARLVEQDEIMEVFLKHPSLIGRFQDDVMIVSTLPRLSERLIPGRSPLKPLGSGDRVRFANALAASDSTLAAYHLAPHLIWQSLFSYRWTELAGHLCLFAENQEGMFMPLPPLGPGPLNEPVAKAMAIMRERNHRSKITRIENIPGELKPTLEALGYRVTPKDHEYLYRARDLAELRGDRYKSQRAAYNRFVRAGPFHYEPYRDVDRDACLALYRDWCAQQERRGLDAVARQMLTDSEAAHREALTHCRDLGLVGRVVRMDAAIRAYTFGYERSPSVFCVLLEVADRSIPGLAQFVFREFCREAFGRGCEFINTMDDSGLPSLARSKRAYHPVRLIPSYIATEP